MPPSFQKPEIALKRSEELIAVGQQGSALQTLYDVLSNKKPRGFNNSSLEPFINKFVHLCVEQKKGKTLKDGLQQYRNMTQNSNIESFESVVNMVLDLSESKIQSAQKQADKLNLETIGDLEESETPESILLSVISSEQSKDRTDRALVTPWLKFLWESYRNLLELLKNNSRFEKLYQSIAQKAIAFCLTYQRKTEFRRLCELLRSHLQAVVKYPNQPYSISLSDAEVMQRYIETRFLQLNAATELELWQESFRSVEDLSSLFIQSRRAVKPSALANYYEKLTRIMFRAENQLFLAAAWHCYFNLIRGQTKAVGEAEIRRAANNVLLSTLAVPIIRPSSKVMSAEASENKYRTQKLTSLLMLSTPPTRQTLISNISRLSVLEYVRPELRPIYDLLEGKFHPLSICKKLTPILRDSIAPNKDEAKYIPLLRNVTLTRLIQQLSQVYSTVRMDVLYKLAEFDDPFKLNPIDIERFIVNGTRRGEFQLRLDYENRAIVFDVDTFDFSKPENMATQLQSSPAELMRLQLSSISVSLSKVQRVVCPEYIAAKVAEHNESVKYAKEAMEIERSSAAARKEYIEHKKKMMEALISRREKEEAQARLLKQQQEEERERAHQAELKIKRERERINKEREHAQREEAKKLAESLKSKAGLSVDIEELENLDTNRLLQLQVEHLEKEKHEVKTRLKNASRQMDHLERAFRQEERALLHEDFDQQQAEDLKNHKEGYIAMVETAKAKHEHDLFAKHRLAKILKDYNITKNVLNERNAEKVAILQAEAQKKLEAAKASRIAEYRKLKAEEESYVPPNKRQGLQTTGQTAFTPSPSAPSPPARSVYVPPKRTATEFSSPSPAWSPAPGAGPRGGAFSSYKKPGTPLGKDSPNLSDSSKTGKTTSSSNAWVPSFRRNAQK
ncbi:hypothetical protein BB559_005116 [Furculomyces boomerangus]|uniref:Eukaryotic translation initiation factor 3 subunit A n=1 Tax=Furculomyces boomerangus TaxID=61424 RepID=A0A2T9YAS9_9FUNG|nr:hypothetical protein BB559_005116 [Furculomyces boomerangus]